MARFLRQLALPLRLVILLAIVLVGFSIWRKHWFLGIHVMELKYTSLGKVAERYAGTPAQNARWANSEFAQLDRYREANRALPPAPPDRVIQYGDSLTDYWVTRAPETFFPGRPYIGRGIAGQATPELLWRFQQDVLDLHPRTVVILAGTNDIVLLGRYIGTSETRGNLEKMVELARQHGIRVVLCSLLPVSFAGPHWQKRATDSIEAMNAWLQSYAAQHNVVYVDYFDALADTDGRLLPDLSPDGLHPNVAGYRIMERLLEQALDAHP
jgi:lysophospholipase L1-like esterase